MVKFGQTMDVSIELCQVSNFLDSNTEMKCVTMPQIMLYYHSVPVVLHAYGPQLSSGNCTVFDQ